MTEIESLLDELIVHNYIKNEHKEKFFKMLLWENITLRTKIKLFKEIPLVGISDSHKKLLLSEIDQLVSDRNSFAHRLSLISPQSAHLIRENHNPLLVDEKYMKKYRERAHLVMARLQSILFAQKGVRVSESKRSAIEWIPVDQIKPDF